MNAKKHKIYFQILLVYFSIVFGTFVVTKGYQFIYSENDLHTSSRRLLSTSNCTKRSVEEFPEDFLSRKEKQNGGVIFHIVMSAYLFMTLAIVCDDYFVSSLERICEVLNLTHDVAGATFMALGGSAPELCTAVIGVFITSSDVGVSTIVGSAVFNVLCVTAICSLFAGRVIHLTWWPILRDCLTYCVTIITLILVMNDGLIHWYEGLIMLIIYTAYVTILYNNEKVYEFVLRVLPINKIKPNSEYTPLEPKQKPMLTGIGSSEDEEMMESGDSSSIHSRLQFVDNISLHEEKLESVFEIPDSFWKRLHWVTMLPITILCFLTIPDCRKPGISRKLFFLTFIMSLVWICISTYLLVWMICITGDTLGIPDTIMGLTLLAAGASVPDAISGFLVAKEGHGDMAICTSIGSNTLDILVGLGLPWLIETGMINPGSKIQISSSGLTYTSMTLLSTVIILMVSIMLNKWKLNRLLGCIFFTLYVAVLIFSCLYELNIFGVFSLEPCPRTRL